MEEDKGQENASSTVPSTDSPIITVYWLNASRADRILFLLEELEVPHAIEKFDRGSDGLAPAELKKIHPLGKSPVIKDGDRVVAESGFIIDYLIDKYGRGKHLKPTNADDLFQYNYVMRIRLYHSKCAKLISMFFFLFL